MATGNCVLCLLLLSLAFSDQVSAEEEFINCNKSFVLNSDSTVGVLQSYNFPFNYRANLSCHYTVYLQSSQTAHICFLFRRFDTNFGEFLSFRQGSAYISYHLQGQLYNKTKYLESVWAETFCWETSNNWLNITFRSLSASFGELSKKGFYATFWANDSNIDVSNGLVHQDVDEDLDEIYPNTTAPCLSEQWTCFNRGCISKNQLCDGLNTCGDLSDEMYSHAGCMTGEWGPSLYGCDFSSGHSCGLLGLAQVGWIMEEKNEDEERGPSSDHTTGNSRGKYVRTSFGRPSENIQNLGLKSEKVILAPNTTHCLSFWYHMTGPRVGRLNVYYVDPTSQFVTPELQRPLWTRTANYHHRWLHGEILVRDEINNGNIYFEGERSYDNNASLAVDDISLRITDLCNTDDLSCNFEFGWCGWKHDLGFKRIQGNLTWAGGPEGDPVSSYGDQFYVAVDLTPNTPTVALTSPLYGGNVDESRRHVACLQVWLYQSDVPIDQYGPYVYIKTRGFDGNVMVHDSLRPITPSTSDDPSQWYTGQWKEFAVDLYHYVPFNVIIESDPIRRSYVTLAVDNPVITEGPCNLVELQSCTPDEYRCNNGICVDMELICDGTPHCTDGSDEEPPACCYRNQCDPGQYCCRGVDKCIFDAYVCDGDNDCGDWSDEDICSSDCSPGLFQCKDRSRCINRRYVCDTHDDCLDGSDERDCLLLPPGAITGIALVAGVIIIMILVRVLLCSKSRPKWCRGLRLCRRNSDSDSEDGDDQEVAPEPVLYQQPPDYAECVNNPMYRRNVSHDSSLKSDSIEVLPGVHTPLPPSYDRIEKGEFETIVVTKKEATRKLRQLIMSKSRDALDSTFDDSSSTFTDRNIADVTGLDHQVPAGTQQVVVEVSPRGMVNPGYRGSTDDLSSSDEASTISRPALKILRAHGHASGKVVSRTGSNISNRSLPRYSDIPHPPAYDNLSFCGDENDPDASLASIAVVGPSAQLATIPESSGRRTASLNSNQHQRDEGQNRNDLTHSRTVRSSSGASSLYRSESDRLSRRVHGQRKNNTTQETTLNKASPKSKSCMNINVYEEIQLDSRPTYLRSKSTTHLNNPSIPSVSYNVEHSSRQPTNSMVAARSMPNLNRPIQVEDGRPKQNRVRQGASRDTEQGANRPMPHRINTEASRDQELSRLGPQQNRSEASRDQQLNASHPRPHKNRTEATREVGLSARALMYQRQVSKSQHNLHVAEQPETDVQTMRRAKSQMTLSSCSESFV